MIYYKWFLCVLLITIGITTVSATELVIGEERVTPGIVFVFEGAIKDHIFPEHYHLAESNTHVHIEARVNWDITSIPKGSVPGGFIPYLHITAKITNERTGLMTFIDLLPHINLIDNFHYARNITLPGDISDPYTVEFNVIEPQQLELSFHKDWAQKFGKKLLNTQKFSYKAVDFEGIARARR